MEPACMSAESGKLKSPAMKDVQMDGGGRCLRIVLSKECTTGGFNSGIRCRLTNASIVVVVVMYVMRMRPLLRMVDQMLEPSGIQDVEMVVRSPPCVWACACEGMSRYLFRRSLWRDRMSWGRPCVSCSMDMSDCLIVLSSHQHIPPPSTYIASSTHTTA